MKPIRVILVDDHKLVRAGVRALLESRPDIEVVGEASNGREALELVSHLRPDIAMMDVMMPELNGLDATARIVSANCGTRVIILTMSSSEEYVLQALRAGANGFLLKDSGPEEMEQALRAVARGETYLTPSDSHHVVAGFLKKQSGEINPLDKLTPRQREVLQLIAEGFSTKEIARKLIISVKTAETHRAQLMDSLDIHDVAGLVRFAIRMGLVSC